MIKVFDINKQWTFLYPRIVLDELDIEPIVNPEGKIQFTVPYSTGGIIITFNSYDKEKREIQATYHMVDNNLKGQIDFKILEKGKLLEGVPSRFCGMSKWRVIQKEGDQPHAKSGFFRSITSRK